MKKSYFSSRGVKKAGCSRVTIIQNFSIVWQMGKKKQTLFSLESESAVISGTEALLTHATEYYKTLFGPGGGNMFMLDPNIWSEDECVSGMDNYELTKPFSKEDIKKALYQMEKNKAAWPDGLPIEFYQVYWNVVKKDIMDFV
jgi:hypothetical protein